jgi:adenylate cyclase class 2
VHSRRVFESNVIFDASTETLRTRGELIRVRQAGMIATLTYKGPSLGGVHKSREEIETRVTDATALETILERLGYLPAFRYEKYRTEYSRPGARGIVTVDETPIGNYIEIEGVAKWIDAAAHELGFSRSDYITQSYGSLYVEFCLEHSIKPTNMTFKTQPGPRGRRH